jgi:membrane associated rhomboid family serine protease
MNGRKAAQRKKLFAFHTRFLQDVHSYHSLCHHDRCFKTTTPLTTMNSNMIVAYGKLLLFPIILPLFVTFLHFQYKCTQKGLVFVTAEGSELAGIYQSSGARRYRQKVIWWESIFLFQPDVTALASHLSINRVTGRTLDFLPSKESWCFINPGDSSPPFICQATLEGTWKQPDDSTNATTLIITSSASKTDGAGLKDWFLSFFGSVSDSSSKSFRRNPQRRVQSHRNLQWLLDHPATAFWVGLNIGAAAILALYKIPPSAIGKLYNNMIHEGEIWRVSTGSTAHYQIWHLGLNMAGLYGLGSQLEGSELSSVGFFFYNLSMIPLVGAVWLGLQYGARRLRWTASSDNTPTVGYSGVLYAWLAVSVFQQERGEILKTFGMMLLYSAIPGISLTGHLAGFLVGAAYRAHLLPLAYAQPSVLIPVLYLVYLYCIRKLFTATENDATANNNRWQLGGGDKTQDFHRILLWCMLGVGVLSLVYFGPQSPLFLSYTMTLVYWYCSVKYSSNTTIQSVLLRGFILAAVLSVITDAMTVGAWMATSITTGGSLEILGTMLLRWLVHGAAVSLACHTLAENENRVGGAFEYTRGIFNCSLGWTILAPAQSVGKQLVQCWRNPKAARDTSILFSGRGLKLGGGGGGGGSHVSDAESRLEGAPSPSSFGGPGRVLGTTRRVPDVELVEQGEMSQLL